MYILIKWLTVHWLIFIAALTNVNQTQKNLEVVNKEGKTVHFFVFIFIWGATV